jgi:methylglutaconyl-CoA hydratase
LTLYLGISVISMNRPASKNAIGRLFLKQLHESIQELRFKKNTRVVILRSTVDGVFCAGADLKERATMTQEEVSVFVQTLRSTFSELENLPVPTIAAIDGAALGGGLEVALACDLRVAGKDAKLGLPETKLAIIPGAGGTQRLPRIVGIAKAKELIFTARVLDAPSAEKIGLVNESTTGKAYERALEVAREIRPKGPVALRMAKQAIDLGMQTDRATGFKIEEACYAQIIPTKDRIEGLTAFKEKREPKYLGE